MQTLSSGQIITFYSYKGGTGRSMALANVACLLAQRPAAVLVIDWDLEAPGLHQFFPRTTPGSNSEGNAVEGVKAPGLIDFFVDILKHCREAQRSPDEAIDDEAVDNILSEVPIERFVVNTNVPSLDLLRAGAFDSRYPTLVSTFPWEDLFKIAPSLFPSLARVLSHRYEFVLIDSRTGFTDTSGICTMLMPEKLVVVFTPNRQSLTGISTLIERALQYRAQSTDERQLIVYPLASRIENAEQELQRKWRFGSEDVGEGYQSLFQKLFSKIYGLPDCDLAQYFQEVQIQHVPRYAYGEQIAVLLDPAGDRLSLTTAYRSFVAHLLDRPSPWHIDEPAPITERTEEQRENERRQQDLVAARKMQDTLLPKRIPDLPPFEILTYWQPAREVGGDYYDIIDFRDGTLGICIGDVVGKSMQAALLLSLLVGEVRNAATPKTSPRSVCTQVNTRLFKNVGEGRYATLFYGVLDTRTHRLAYTNAGHNPPLLLPFRDEPVRLEGGGMPLGLFEKNVFGEYVVHLGPGYRMLMFTDGVTELQNRDDEDDLFGDDRVAELLLSTRNRPAKDVLDTVVADLQSFGGGKYQDDVTLLLVSVKYL